MLKEILNVVIPVIFVCAVFSLFLVLRLYIYNEFVLDDKIVMLEKENKQIEKYYKKLLKENIELHNKIVDLYLKLEKTEKELKEVCK